ncbi:alpha/beta-hydrolase [Hypoxylon sp. FL1857]|nr:alpha/beta-hydrolase [Hypoxylon sp. FL1857]
MATLKPSLSPLFDEKHDDVFRSGVRVPSRERGWRWGCRSLSVVFLAIVSGIGLLSHFSYGPIRYGFRHPESGSRGSSQYPEGWTEWSDITPSEKLIWQPCFQIYGDGFKCARLTVPMDYHRPLNESADNPKVHIALVLKPGINRTEDPASYSESPLLINPGGPGGSGALFTLATGQMLQTVVGKDRDIIGFDPRGVGATTPKADCFASPDDPFGLDGRNVAYMNRLSWVTSGHDVGIVNSSNVALSKLDSRSRALSKLCKRRDDAEGDSSIFRYSNTANMARDMLSIVDAWDQWRLGSNPKPAKCMQEPGTVDEHRANTKLEAKDSTQGKLVYWGFSYGTILGATFASMFPDRVGRVILDGVVDADHYVDRVMADAILDTDAIWEKFFVYCAEAGPQCSLFKLGDKPESIKKRVNDIMSWLEKEPAIIIPKHANIPILLTASDFKLVIFMALYSPNVVFPAVAILFKALIDGRLDEHVASPAPTFFCHNLTLPQWPDDAQKVIGCSDKRYKLNDDLETLQKRFEEMASYSSFADVWMGVGFNLGCNGWDIESKDPPMRWDDHPIHKPEPIDTSFPVLFLSNHLDPVTPLHSALKMTRKFSGASIVEQKAEGHCTVSCISLCTISHIRAYLNKGVVPPAPRYDSEDEGEWTTCECYERPWKSLNDPPPIRAGSKIADFNYTLNPWEAGIVEITKSYSGVRNHFAEFMASQQHSEYQNPFNAALLFSSLLRGNEHHTCGKPEEQ